MSTDTLSGITPNASAWLDVRGYDAATIEILTGAVTDAGTAAGFTATLQHSDTTANGDAANVSADEAVNGTVTVTVTDDAADNVVAGALGYLGNKRYIRVNYVGTTNTAAVVRTIGRLGRPHRAPTTYIGASVAAT
ncbi:MAG: hypothetical protein COZ09_10115 [Comamonadaceae bacterium CG_4_10_14_3_um_filter_60_42]|nr:MAG: hypothetical protein COZ09_10115 [Comamonadaceae bacterium CG_4_10_14_3_um_filter_60_42]